jgi:hypothetical protein
MNDIYNKKATSHASLTYSETLPGHLPFDNIYYVDMDTLSFSNIHSVNYSTGGGLALFWRKCLKILSYGMHHVCVSLFYIVGNSPGALDTLLFYMNFT